MSINIRFISAGAGSGKTYRLTKDLKKLLADKKVRPSGVIATTFTRLAAEELRQRVRQELMASGQVIAHKNGYANGTSNDWNR